MVQVYQVIYYWLLKVKRVHINSICKSISGNVWLTNWKGKECLLIVFRTSISRNVLLITESEKSAY